ncbi:growth/differentiation factor 2 [Osmerus eperlanus]|uniref:growth/differentiation factor 2 n=1 Tax=Osmerus eperlanus TaxID=29151 RepID=UPI002E0ED4C0
MQCSRTFLFQMCLSLLVSTGSCRCKPLNKVILTEDPEGFFHFSDQDLIEEDEVEANAQSKLESFLVTMKEEFLRKLNLLEAPQEHSRIYPPQFMMELYNKYASDTSAMPRSDVIRSFNLQDLCHSERNGSRSKHRLLFNVTVPDHEEVTMAELRLFTLPEERSSTGVRGTIRVYELDHTGSKPTPLLLDGREVMGSHPSWEAFDVTHAIQCWSSRGRGRGVSAFEVVVDQWEGGRTLDDVGSDRGDGAAGEGLDVSVAVGVNTSAALLVFSDDLSSRRREAREELREMILREEETVLSSGSSPQNEDDENINDDNINNNIDDDGNNPTAADGEDDHGSAGVLSRVDLHPRRRRRRRRRQAESSYCRRTSMRVNFKDIGWDKWIVAPPEYDAFECRGVCFFPLTKDMTPSKHALIQTLVNLRNPKKANMACCVPTKLDPITVMYQEKGIITVRHLYEEMKVAACGCR